MCRPIPVQSENGGVFHIDIPLIFPYKFRTLPTLIHSIQPGFGITDKRTLCSLAIIFMSKPRHTSQSSVINKEKEMQMAIGAIGFGIGIPRTKVQVGAGNIAKFYVRKGPLDKNPGRFHVQDLISIGGKS